jgi:hypothetical protein
MLLHTAVSLEHIRGLLDCQSVVSKDEVVGGSHCGCQDLGELLPADLPYQYCKCTCLSSRRHISSFSVCLLQ